MAGRFTRGTYDLCSINQSTQQSIEPVDFVMDPTKYVNNGNLCNPSLNFMHHAQTLTDIESSLQGRDKSLSRCDSFKYPLCGNKGCLLTTDPRIPQHSTPYACERGKQGDTNTVVNTNRVMPTHPGYVMPNQNVCSANRSNYFLL